MQQQQQQQQQHAVMADVVLSELQRATSPNASDIMIAEKQLKSLECNEGFYSCVESVFASRTTSLHVRWLAIIYLKNGFDRYWRPTAPRSINEEERIHLRSRMLTHFDEPCTQLALQLAVVIGKMARIDVPHRWPELLPCLLQHIQHPNILIHQRSMLTMHYVLKDMSSKRLDRSTMLELAPELLGYVLQLWQGHTSSFLQLTSPSNETVNDDIMVPLTLSHLALKLVRRLLIYGFKSITDNEGVTTFLGTLVERIRNFEGVYYQLGDGSLRTSVKKSLHLYVKILIEVQGAHSLEFIPWFKDALMWALDQIVVKDGQREASMFNEKLQVQAMIFIRKVLKCDKYNVEDINDEPVSKMILLANRMLRNTFTSSSLKSLVGTLVSHYLILSSNDLEQWDSSPEEFAFDDEGENWLCALRPCAENLFLALLEKYQVVVGSTLVELISYVSGHASGFSDILLKDAVYSAVALGSYNLVEAIDFDAFFRDQLLKEVHEDSTHQRILQRRIAMLIRAWVDVRLAKDMRPLAHNILLLLMSPNHDIVVRLAATEALRVCVEDWNFSAAEFRGASSQQCSDVPISLAIAALLRLLHDVEEADTRGRLLAVGRSLVVRVGAPDEEGQFGVDGEIGARKATVMVASSIADCLPTLWKSAEGSQSFLRCEIVRTLTELVKAVGSDCASSGLLDFVVPIIRYCTDPLQPAYVFLCEDALELWEATLKRINVAPPELASLFETVLLPLTRDMASEYLLTVFSIVESYAMLLPPTTLAVSASIIAGYFNPLLDAVRTQAVSALCSVVDVLLRCGGPDMASGLMSFFSNILMRLLNGEKFPPLVASFLSLLARLFVIYPHIFSQLVCNIKAEDSRDGTTMLQLLSIWLSHVDVVTGIKRRQLCSMALASFLDSHVFMDPLAEPVFDLLVNAIVDALFEAANTKGNSEINGLTDLDAFLGDECDDDDRTLEHDRRAQMERIDPTLSKSLATVVSVRMTNCRTTFGEEKWSSLMAVVDPTIITQLQTLLS